MPRSPRSSIGGVIYHVLNRGNGGSKVFHNDDDYAAFVALLADANERISMRLLGYVLMPDHFHLVLWPRRDGDLRCCHRDAAAAPIIFRPIPCVNGPARA